jgi:carbonic anhydrase/acetyltransferase-like protein (isoleucine patch superfamily)
VIVRFEGKIPAIDPTAFVAPDATLLGRVEIGAQSSVWYRCVLRGDEGPIVVGRRCNIQDGTVIHVAGEALPTTIGDDVAIGHMALIHACTLESGAFVGMRAVVMDGAVVEGGGVLAAGALLTPGKRLPAGELWAGQPARFLRRLNDKDRAMVEEVRSVYLQMALRHKTAIAGGSAGR